MTAKNDYFKRVGEFLVENRIITRTQLDDALDMQRYNKDRLVGEILVTQGVLSKEQLIMSLEMYLVMTDLQPEHFDEWLDQEEVDLIIDRIRQK